MSLWQRTHFVWFSLLFKGAPCGFVNSISWLRSFLPHWGNRNLSQKKILIKISIPALKETVFLICNLQLNKITFANIFCQRYDVKLTILLKEELVTSSQRVEKNLQVVCERYAPPTGLEPAILGSEGRCLIHLATEAWQSKIILKFDSSHCLIHD